MDKMRVKIIEAISKEYRLTRSQANTANTNKVEALDRLKDRSILHSEYLTLNDKINYYTEVERELTLIADGMELAREIVFNIK